MKGIGFRRFIVSFFVLSVFYAALLAVFEKDYLYPLYEWRFRPGGEGAAIKETMIVYNLIYTDLYASGGVPARLNDFPASKRLRHELFRDIGFLRNRGLILVYDMADNIFVDVKRPSPSTAEVTEFEEWNYIYQKKPSRIPAIDIKGMGQGFKYFLVREGEKWIVVDYMPVDVKVKKKDEFLF
jgi:hypothetical protein